MLNKTNLGAAFVRRNCCNEKDASCMIQNVGVFYSFVFYRKAVARPYCLVCNKLFNRSDIQE